MKRILVADDEDILRMLIVDSLEELEHEIDEAEDGKEALELLRTNNYDVAILDYMMPEMTGLEVVQSLDETEKMAVQLVMLTAKAQEKDREVALSSGIQYFIAKPFSPIELVQTVEEILSK